MNKVFLIGRAVRDPELKFTPGKGTPVCRVTMAVDRPYSKDKKEADFIPIIIWNKPAENTATYVAKGKLFAVSGKIQNRQYTAKDSTKRYVTEVIADDVQFLEWANNGQTPESHDGYTPVGEDDGEIPF